MKSKLKVLEIRKDTTIDLPKGALPLRLDKVVEPNGLVNPAPSEEKFLLYYLEEES